MPNFETLPSSLRGSRPQPSALTLPARPMPERAPTGIAGKLNVFFREKARCHVSVSLGRNDDAVVIKAGPQTPEVAEALFSALSARIPEARGVMREKGYEIHVPHEKFKLGAMSV